MKFKDKVLLFIKKNPDCSSNQLSVHFNMSRQGLHRYLKILQQDNLIIKTGSTKNTTYALAKSKNLTTPTIDASNELKLVKNLKSLEEDRVFDEINLKLSLQRKCSKNIYFILNYSFTEMLNNAIDHSQSSKVTIHFSQIPQMLSFEITDRGIGIFFNLMTKFKLKNEFEGLEHLLKGKQTTLPSNHTGQGVFFTSRIADRFEIRSHKLILIVDNQKNDIFVGEQRHTKGTKISFFIKSKSKKKLKSLFDQFANEDYEFDRTNYRVKLTADRELLSRSQAKRILFGLEVYKKIIFDFSKVKIIGQAFADEIFRVFQNHHPHIELTFANSNEVVAAMIIRALRK